MYWGPSYQMTSSTCASAFCASSPKTERYGSGLRKWTTPVMPGSFAQRRLSPPRLIAPCVWPWKLRHWVRILWRPVYRRASLIAFSFASVPPVVKIDLVRSPGATSAILRASVAWASEVKAGET